MRGRTELTATATGERSGLGRLVAMVRDAPSRRTPLQDRMRRLSLLLVLGVLALTMLVVALGLLRGGGWWRCSWSARVWPSRRCRNPFRP